MKQQVLTVVAICMFATSLFAQFNASSIWNLNRSVDPMPHNTLTLIGIKMSLTYNATGVPLTGTSTAPSMGIPTFRITSTVTGNKTVCISSEKEGNDPWEDKERATFESDGTNDTAVTVEESNNGSPFTNTAKIVIERGSNPNQYTILQYRFRSDNTWALNSKLFYYLSNGRIDSLVSYRYTGTDSTRSAVRTFYYSNGLDSVLENSLNVTTGQFVVNGRFLVLQKENGKTKEWALESRQTATDPFQRNATITYSNGPASSIGENNIEDQISIYPNPTTESINISSNNQSLVKSISILNMNGQLLKQVSNASMLDIQDLANGLYFIQITTNKGTSTQKFTKQ
jgi:hypothetical protein